MSELKPVSFYTASELDEAAHFSPVLRHYLNFAFSSKDALHKDRTQAWLAAALATILNTHSAEEVCLFWSEFARKLLAEVFQECFQGASAALFALGKLGSNELNLSSDVDVLIISQEEDPQYLRSLRQFQKILSERTPQGFLFRVDFDLRPGGRQGPLIPTIDQLVDYYGNYGETWERLAFVRLVGIAGSPHVISDVLSFSKKFTYRKHLDYTLLDDLKSLRGKIRHHYPQSKNESLDLKLGRGGIRDVELFTHALQVIHGGKNPRLQVASTTKALEILGETRVLPSEDFEFLKYHYWRLRQLENFVQAQNDEQTHLLDRNTPLPLWAQEITASLSEDLEHCDRIVASLLGEALTSLSPSLTAITSRQQAVWEEILQLEVLSRNKDRDEQARLHFLNEFSVTLQKQGGDIEKALLHLKDFIKSIRAKASFFTLLMRNKKLLDELAWLFGHSPYLSQILSSRPELIDSYVYRSQELAKGDLALLLEQLVEKRLLGELINGSHFLEDKNILTLQLNLSATADEIAMTLLEELKKEYPSDLDILCLGKWGGQELGFRSDLDFIFLSPDEIQENDSKLARRFINRLSESRKGGSIYAIDMRLRPSGKAGPFVISISQLMEYLSTEAQSWERQAYLKARSLLSRHLSLQACVLKRGLSPTDLQELERIRQELIRYSVDSLDLKYAEGGILDLELFAQTRILKEQKSVLGTSTVNFLSEIPETKILQKNYLRMRQIEQMAQLVSTEGGAKLRLNHESFQHLAKALQTASEELQRELRSLINENLQWLNELDPRRRTKILKPE